MKKSKKPDKTSPGWHSMPDADYFALDHLSNSRLKLLDKSAAHLKSDIEHERQVKAKKIDPDIPTPAQVFGSAYHAYMLGYPGKIAIIPEGINKRTKEGKAEWLEFEEAAADKAVITGDDFEKIKKMHDALYKHPAAAKLMQLKGALREAAGLFIHPVFGFPCKIKTDLVSLSNRWIVDLKSAISAQPQDFSRAIANFKYHWQALHYTTGAQALDAGKPFKFLIIAQEKDEPFAPAVYEIGKAWIEIAQRQVDPLLNLYAHCLETDKWPGYNEQVIISEPPAWAAKY